MRTVTSKASRPRGQIHVYGENKPKISRPTLLRTAADLRAHCLQHNDKAPLGFAFCPCETASELERMAGPAVQG